jgi:hypothetical protein
MVGDVLGDVGQLCRRGAHQHVAGLLAGGGGAFSVCERFFGVLAVERALACTPRTRVHTEILILG